MGHFKGRVIEVRLEAGGEVEACIACPAEAIPEAGQYLMASDLSDPQEVLSTPLYLTEKSRGGFWAAPPIPAAWKPGTQLSLVGPLGCGFTLPGDARRLGLLALGGTPGRLMPLVQLAAAAQQGMTLFTDTPLPSVPWLPASLEVYPVASLREALDWPDFMVIDLPLMRLADLRSTFGLPDGGRLPFPAQVLITTPMPCAGLARCGACAVPSRRGWKLACEDGPVFDLGALKW